AAAGSPELLSVSHPRSTFLPPPHSHKPDTPDEWIAHLFSTLRDDEPDASESHLNGYWQPTPAAAPPRQGYDAWADEISHRMQQRRGVAGRMEREAEAERARERARMVEIEREDARRRAAVKRRARAGLSTARAECERRWGVLRDGGGGLLGIEDLPMPVVEGGRGVRRVDVEAFLLEGVEGGELRRRVVKGALLLWHPDKMARYLPRFPEALRGKVVELVNQVAGILNTLNAEVR
ncbi:hypothetical protein BDK51DRAFT_53278, partial [Blyttiomyces helicus]